MEAIPLQILDAYIHRTWDVGNHQEQWRNLPEIPTKAEIMPKDDENRDQQSEEEKWNDYQNDPLYDPKLPKNIIDGPWSSKEDYISAHYQILREDAVAPLREAIKSFKQHPHMADDNGTCIYTHVHFKGLNLSPFGAAFRITFSTERAGKQIRWEQSKRLLQGSIVALSPASDMFQKVCKIAVVAARPIINGLDQNPPVIDLFWGEHTDAAFDPVEPYIMIESRQGYFEAYRHVLVGLQKLRTESFPLANHIVQLDLDICPPEYLKKHSILDFSSLVPNSVDNCFPVLPDETDLRNVDVLKGFPTVPISGMDASQTSALERMITKRVAVIQGPPGTGKTFTSVSALKVLLSNLGPDDPPVIIAAQTNHALDQLIKHVQVFQENIVRLGGRSDRENVEIIKRTIHELRRSTPNGPSSRRELKFWKIQLDQHISKIQCLMSPLLKASFLTDDMLMKHGLITDDQKDSLYEPGWYEANQSQANTDSNATTISAWLGEGGLVSMPRTPQINLGLPMEEADLEFEQLQDLEQELEGPEFQEDKERESLFGKWLPFLRELTGKASTAVDDRKIRRLLSSHRNLYDIPEVWRGSIYRYWEKQINKECLAQLKILLAEYKRIIDKTKVAKWHSNIKLIRHLNTKCIGCTTTGLSKYRPLLAALQPRILLIEEAAETLEGHAMAGSFDSLEQLILVGDHKQLQAHCSVKALEGAPYHMGVSLFERLISNSMAFTMLNTQRRMVPDIRKLLCIEPEPFYPDLQDHPSVEDRLINRAPVPGMGGRDTYFFHHTWPETKGSDLSRQNQDEAEMIVGFYYYLILNGVKHAQITVLTFYNGQRKTILKELKTHPGLRGNTYFNVFTVDSYQGEENDIILLSLVRSNEHLGIGFLDSRNRLVVALSRARRGLYLFGNAITLIATETSEIGWGRDVLWTPIITFLKEQGRFDLDGGLPITCSNHGTVISIMEADEWLGLAGGCDEDCGGILPCGHDCPLKCHPFDHEMVLCRNPCPKILACGHSCGLFCSEVCECSQCEKVTEDITAGDHQTTKLDLMSDHKKEPGLLTSGTFSQYNSSRGYLFGTKNDTYRSQRLGSRSSSHGLALINPSMTTRRSGPGSPGQWQNWDAVKSDAEMAEKARQMEAIEPTMDYSKIVFKDTWHPISLENGERSVSKPERQLIRQDGADLVSLLEGASIVPVLKTDAVAVNASHDTENLEDTVAQMPRIDLSHQGHDRGFSTSRPPNIIDDDNLNIETTSRAPGLDFADRTMGGHETRPSSAVTHLEYIESSPYFEPASAIGATSTKALSAKVDEFEDLIDLSNDVDFSPAVFSEPA